MEAASLTILKVDRHNGWDPHCFRHELCAVSTMYEPRRPRSLRTRFVLTKPQCSLGRNKRHWCLHQERGKSLMTVDWRSTKKQTMLKEWEYFPVAPLGYICRLCWDRSWISPIKLYRGNQHWEDNSCNKAAPVTWLGHRLLKAEWMESKDEMTERGWTTKGAYRVGRLL